MANLSQKGAVVGEFAGVCDQKFLDIGNVLGQQCAAFSRDPSISHDKTFEQGIGGPA